MMERLRNNREAYGIEGSSVGGRKNIVFAGGENGITKAYLAIRKCSKMANECIHQTKYISLLQ
jgi:hypothetical protein